MIELERNASLGNQDAENRTTIVAQSTQQAKDASKASGSRTLRDHELVIIVDNSSTRVAGKRSKRDLDIETSSIKKARGIDVMIEVFSLEEPPPNYNKTQYTRDCVILLFMIKTQEQRKKILNF